MSDLFATAIIVIVPFLFLAFALGLFQPRHDPEQEEWAYYYEPRIRRAKLRARFKDEMRKIN